MLLLPQKTTGFKKWTLYDTVIGVFDAVTYFRKICTVEVEMSTSWSAVKDIPMYELYRNINISPNPFIIVPNEDDDDDVYDRNDDSDDDDDDNVFKFPPPKKYLQGSYVCCHFIRILENHRCSRLLNAVRQCSCL